MLGHGPRTDRGRTRVVALLALALLAPAVASHGQETRSAPSRPLVADDRPRVKQMLWNALFDVPFRLKAVTVPLAPIPTPKAALEALARGEELESRGETSQATREYDRVVELLPNAICGYFARGVLYAKSEKTDLALANLNRVLALDPRDASALSWRAHVLLQKKPDVERALADLDKAIGLAPQNAELYQYRGTIHLQKEDFAKAIADLTEATKIDPDEARSFELRATVYRALNDHERACASLDEAIDLGLETAEVYANRAESRALCGDLDGALADYAQAARIDPKNPWPRFYRGVLLTERGEFRSAVDEFDAALRLKPDHAMILCVRANALLEMGESQKALADLTRVRELKPDVPFLPLLLSRAYTATGQTERARAELARGAGVNPRLAMWSAAAEVTRAENHGDFAGALAACDRLKALDPRGADADCLRGTILNRMGNYAGAVAAFDRSLALRPDFFPALLFRGLAHARNGHPDRALADYDRAHRLRPAEPAVLVGRGQAYAFAGDDRRAVADFSEALQQLGRGRRLQGARVGLHHLGRRSGLSAKVFHEIPGDAAGTKEHPFSFYEFYCAPDSIYFARGLARLRLKEPARAFSDFGLALASTTRASRVLAVSAGASALQGDWIPAFVRVEHAVGAATRPLLPQFRVPLETPDPAK